MPSTIRFSVDHSCQIGKFIQMLVRERDLLDWAQDRDARAEQQTTHEGPTDEAIRALAEQRYWAAQAGRRQGRCWTRRDVRWHRHNAGQEPYQPWRRVDWFLRRFSTTVSFERYRAALHGAGLQSIAAPALKRAWDAREEVFELLRSGKRVPFHEGLNAAISELLDYTKPPEQASNASVASQSVPETTSTWVAAAARVNVDKQKGLVSVDGEAHSVTPDTVELLAAIVEGNGEYVAAGKVVSRPDRIMKNAPSAVQSLIERTNHGYRLQKQYVTNTPT